MIGFSDAQRLSFLKIMVNDNPCSKQEVKEFSHQSKKMCRDKILNEFPDLFQGLGELGPPCKISIDSTVTPVIHAPRKVPLNLQKKLKAQLDSMEGTVIEKVTEPTDWVSSMVLVTKPNSKDLRICLDPMDLNQAIKRPHYPLPVIEEILPKLGKAKIFSVLDAKNGFWQVKLDRESSYPTTFNTPFGRYRWKRMPFGISSAPEEHQRRMNDALVNLKGVVVIADDILVYGEGSTDADAEEDHDRNLMALLHRCCKENIKLNMDKLKLHLTDVTYIGHQLTKDGVKPDPRKIEAINSLKTPTDVKSLRRFLGMVNYLSKFLPRLSDAMQPLRSLEKKNVSWHWDSCHDDAFAKIKKMIVEAPVLKYFDGSLDVTLQCDASMTGLGAVLMQDGQPIAYASKALTETEQRYAQIEKEMLAIVFAAFHFEQYIFGKTVNIETDHKPLKNIFKKSLLKCPKRLQSMLLQLQKFSVNVQYKPGNKMYIADALSRDYLPNKLSCVDNTNVIFAFEEVNSVIMTENVAVTDERLEDIKQKGLHDKEMQMLKNVIITGWPNNCKDVPELIRPYFKFRDELSVDNDIVFRGTCIIVPSCLRSYMIKQIHYAHTGIDATIRHGRDILFWPNMCAELKNYVASCKICNKYNYHQGKEPLKSHNFPSRPWSKVGMDIFSVGSNNYLILVDYYSSYFEINSLENLQANTVVNKVRSHFARYGIPDIVVSDCGSQFLAKEFQQLANQWCFKHVKSSPYHHQSNGKAENAVKIMKQLFLKAKEDNRDPQLALLEWRNTPTEGFNSSPAQRFFGRRTRSLLPTTEKALKPKIVDGVPEIQAKKLEKQAKYYNRTSKSLKNLKPGEIIRMQPTPGEKVWRKGKVITEVSPRKYQVEVNGKSYYRNRKFLRRTSENSRSENYDESLSDDLSFEEENHDDHRTRPPDDTHQPRGASPEPRGASPEIVRPILREPQRTRSGRAVRTPSYLQDYTY